jgi:glycosyltransferase involved in cell wall biosynthesis
VLRGRRRREDPQGRPGPPPRVLCTTATAATALHVRALGAAAALHDPEARFVVLAADAHTGAQLAGTHSLEVLELEALRLELPRRLIETGAWADISVLARPALLRELLRRHGAPVAYLDADMDLHGGLEPVVDVARRTGVAMAERMTGGLPEDGRLPKPADLVRAGRVTAAFAAVAPSTAAERFLDRWETALCAAVDRLEYEPSEQSSNVLLAHRALVAEVDAAASMPEVTLLEDPGCNVSAWNLHQRRLERVGESFTVDDRPLRFFHFSGFQPTRPWWLASFADRAEIAASPALASLCAQYAAKLQAEGLPGPAARRVLSAPAPAPAPPVETAPFGVEVAGYLRSALGLGQAARHYVKALQAACVPVGTLTVPLTAVVDATAANAAETREYADFEAPREPDVSLVCVNGKELPFFIDAVEPSFFERRRTVGVWGWETDVVPDDWLSAVDVLDEVWVYSKYVAQNLGRALPIPVVTIPPPVIKPQPPGAPPTIGERGLFTFLFVLDLNSTAARKNPLGVIEAYREAFSPEEGTQLIIKTIHARMHRMEFAELHGAAGRRPDIVVLDRYLREDEQATLMSACNCYVSLHRSEGFGLTIAEAMALGKPVIATGFSGNTDFMAPGNSHLVRYTLTTVTPGTGIYPETGRWAEPDIDHAATLMRQVVGDPDGSAAMGARAAADIARDFSVTATGAIARRRLERLLDRHC